MPYINTPATSHLQPPWQASTTTVDNLMNLATWKKGSNPNRCHSSCSIVFNHLVFVRVQNETESHHVVMILVTLTWEKHRKTAASLRESSSFLFLRFYPGHHWWKHFATCGACRRLPKQEMVPLPEINQPGTHFFVVVAQVASPKMFQTSGRLSDCQRHN